MKKSSLDLTLHRRPSKDSTGSGGPRWELLDPKHDFWPRCRLFAALLISLVICCLTIIGQLWPMYWNWYLIKVSWKGKTLKSDFEEEPCNLFQLVRGQLGDGHIVSPIFLFMWAGLLPHVKQAILVYALWRGSKDGDSLPVRVPHAYGWLEALGRLAFFNQWVTAAHCGLSSVESFLPGAMKVSVVPVDFNFTFHIDPGVGIFISTASQFLSQALGAAVVKHPRRLPHQRVSMISFLAPRLTFPRDPTLQTLAQTGGQMRRTFSLELKPYFRSQLWARLVDCAILLNVLLLPIAFFIPMVSILVRASIEEKVSFITVRMHRDLTHGVYSIADIIWIVTTHGPLGKLMAFIVAVLVVFIPLLRAVLLIIAWYAAISREIQVKCAKAASWCGLFASFDVFIIAAAVTVFEVPAIFEQTEALFLTASFAPGFCIVFLVALMETGLAAVVVRVVALVRALEGSPPASPALAAPPRSWDV